MSQITSTFDGLGIAPKLAEFIDTLKFKSPTPIQKKAIPIGIEGKDLVGIAQTGTGKTLAFSVPVVQNLTQGPGRALIVVPTRELALQVDETLKKIAQQLAMASAVLIGGSSMTLQIRALKKNPRVIVATPGRLIDHVRQGNLRLEDVRILVLDEADRMFDMGFAPEVNRIIRSISEKRQIMLFSATMPAPIMKMASQHMQLPVRVEIAPSGTTAEKVTQELFIVKKQYKKILLKNILDQYRGSVLLFSRTKVGATILAKDVRQMGHRGAEIHSDRTLAQRREALEGFKSGKYRILIATDIAARGIDVTGIEIVINYDIPDDPENYIHRIGRTGRAGHTGHAISFATPDQRNDVVTIERLIQTSIPVSKHPEVPGEDFAKPMRVFSSAKFGRRRRLARARPRR